MNGRCPHGVNGEGLAIVAEGESDNDRPDATPGLFDAPDSAPAASGQPTATPATSGMRAALDSEGDFGCATLRQLIMETAKRKRTFSASDIDHNLVATASPNSFSATFGHLARAGAIREVGVQRSTRPEARGRLERLWELAR